MLPSENIPISIPDIGNPGRVIGRRTFDFSRELAIMAIINRTQDSFYDRGRTFAFDTALAAIDDALAAGADWIDIGAVPFSPLSANVSEQEEIDRVIPLIEAVRNKTDAVLSVDTFRSGPARQALSAGADVINDTSGLSDPEMARVIAQAGGAVIITHSKAAPRQKLSRPTYSDVVEEVRRYLAERAGYAQDQGIDRGKIIVDPGHDLNKNTYHSLELTRRLNELNDLGYPLLVSVSNKDFIAETLNLPINELTAGTLATLTVCVLQGARILRVHDVRAAISAMSAVGPMLGLHPKRGS
jgi:dihydropteroate synthase